MSTTARLHVKASIWGESDNRIAVLLLEGETDRQRDGDDLLARAALTTGLRTVADLGRLALTTPRGWQVRLDGGRLVTVNWPPGRKLLSAAPLFLPGAWRWAANRTGRVVLFIGSGMGLARSKSGETDRTAELARIAGQGNLVGGAVRFVEQ